MYIEKKKSKWKRYLTAIAAVFVLLVGTVSGLGYYHTNIQVASTVQLDVNPSIEIKVNQKERVLQVVPLNNDGMAIVGDMDFSGSSLDVTVNALIGSMLRTGYLSELANSILVSVDNNDPQKSTELQERLAEEISALISGFAFDGAVLCQTVNRDEALRQLAEEYGVTQGKAQLIEEIIAQNAMYTFADLASLSINELNLIRETGGEGAGTIHVTGSASEKAYIGEPAAKAIALEHAGVADASITGYEWELDYEYGRMVYELEFSSGTNSYDYDIDAVTGEILAHEMESHEPTGKVQDQPESPTQPHPTTPPDDGQTDIGSAAARQIALDHAGVSESSISNYSCKRDWEDGQLIYEIEFDCGEYSYDYDIDAGTGTVLKWEKELD